MTAPQIICPFSRTGDIVAGATADEVALNLAEGTRIVFALPPSRKKNMLPCPDVWSEFRGCHLSPEARRALMYVAAIYTPFRREVQPVSSTEQRQVAELVDAGGSPGGTFEADQAHHLESSLAGSSPALPSTFDQGGQRS